MLQLRTEHRYARPSWDCRRCGRPWPCARARADLVEQFDPAEIALTAYLSAVLFEALNDHVVRSVPVPSDLHDRILGWIRQVQP
ncbi:hypothetical protein OHA21_28220 [Actinoplanes sp. NBC_00393]|uniref:hypothetical protein n=1 Tax=Actinoplanes sp. NBC_00393 TaxID=2975953 RepID=UPI002E1D9783